MSALDLGFDRLVLDTTPRQEATIALYEAFGCEEIRRESTPAGEMAFYENTLGDDTTFTPWRAVFIPAFEVRRCVDDREGVSRRAPRGSRATGGIADEETVRRTSSRRRKTMDISRMVNHGFSKESIREKMDVCANCHRKEHYEMPDPEHGTWRSTDSVSHDNH